MASITYREPVRVGNKYTPDNCEDVLAFIWPQPKCPTCGGSGEYLVKKGATDAQI